MTPTVQREAVGKEAVLVPKHGRNHELASAEHIRSPVSLEGLLQPALQLPSMSGGGATATNKSRFTELFPSLNEQAIDLLVRQSEPETALDMLRQALSELNAEKKI